MNKKIPQTCNTSSELGFKVLIKCMDSNLTDLLWPTTCLFSLAVWLQKELTGCENLSQFLLENTICVTYKCALKFYINFLIKYWFSYDFAHKITFRNTI